MIWDNLRNVSPNYHKLNVSSFCTVKSEIVYTAVIKVFCLKHTEMKRFDPFSLHGHVSVFLNRPCDIRLFHFCVNDILIIHLYNKKTFCNLLNIVDMISISIISIHSSHSRSAM